MSVHDLIMFSHEESFLERKRKKERQAELFPILCFGDSNTWGFSPDGGGRMSPNQRWPGQLRSSLAKNGDYDFFVVEEGLNGRTTCRDDPTYNPPSARNGLGAITMLLESHKPLRLVLIALGTNDLKNFYNASAKDVADGVAQLVKAVRNREGEGAISFGHSFHIAVIIPPPPHEKVLELPYGEKFDDPEKGKQLKFEYLKMGEECGCDMIVLEDCGSPHLPIRSSPLDGIHFDPPVHSEIGQAISAYVLQRTSTPKEQRIVFPSSPSSS